MVSRSLGVLHLARRTISSFGSLSNSNSSIDVIELWRRVLAGVHAPDQDQSFKDLVATGISLNKGRHQNLFPDELIANFRSYYSTLDFQNKHRLFHSLATVFSLDKTQIDATIENWHAIRSREIHSNSETAATSAATATATSSSSPDFSSDEASLRAAERLYQSTQPLYSRLWTPLAQQHDGLSFLVDLRGDLLECIAAHPAGAGPLRLMAEGLRRTLAGWFNVGLLQLERVTWENTPAAMLEQIAAEEKVHSMSHWTELKSRLGADRRVFAWTHPSLPGEPLVALHVALCSNMSSTMDDILLKENRVSENSLTAPSAPTVAMFYSISNMKRGLTGVDLGNNLIKRAAKELVTEIPSLNTLATLSPLPGFAAWVESTLTRVVDHGEERKLTEVSEASPPLLWSLLILSPEEKEQLKKVKIMKEGEEVQGATASHASLLQQALTSFRSSIGSPQDSILLKNALKGPLLRLAAYYLLKEKHRGRALDSVANFHLRNGASMHRLNWLADGSAAGMERSYGIMVNYMYDMNAVEENNRKYILHGEISASKKVEALLDIQRKQEN